MTVRKAVVVVVVAFLFLVLLTACGVDEDGVPGQVCSTEGNRTTCVEVIVTFTPED